MKHNRTRIGRERISESVRPALLEGPAWTVSPNHIAPSLDELGTSSNCTVVDLATHRSWAQLADDAVEALMTAQSLQDLARQLSLVAPAVVDVPTEPSSGVPELTSTRLRSLAQAALAPPVRRVHHVHQSESLAA